MIKQFNLNDFLMATKRKWIPAFPTIFVSIFIFLTVLKGFGIRYVILTSFLTLLFQTRRLQDFRPRAILKTCIIMYLVCIGAFLATRSLFTCIIFNFFIPFFVVVLLTDKFNPKAYFVYGMEFVFLQLTPITAKDLPKQLLALTYGMIIVVIALYLFSKLIKRKRHYGTVRKGMKNLSIQLEKLLCGEDFSSDSTALTQMMYHMNQVIYSSRNYTYLATGYGKINYYFMLLFQRFQYFMHHFSRKELVITEEDRTYFLKLIHIFSSIEKEMNPSDNQKLNQQLNDFIENHALSSKKATEAMNQILSILIYALSTITMVSMHRPEKDWKVPSSSNWKTIILSFFQLDRFQIRFALRLAVVLCISFTFCFATKLNHAYWYPMSAFLMLMPYAEESRMKISNRIIGTCIGLCITFILTGIFTSLNSHIVIILIMTCFMYAAPITSWTLTMYTTCYGMSLTTLMLDREEAILLRLLYVGLAAITTILANHFLLPNTAESEFKKSVNALFDIDVQLIKELQKWQTGKPDMDVFRDLIVHSNLMSNEIQTYMNQNMSTEEKDFYKQLLPINRQLVSEMEQLNSYLNKRKDQLDLNNNLLFNQLFQNLADATKRIRVSYTTNQLNGSIMMDKNLHTFGPLDDNLYFNTLAFNCMRTTNHLIELSTMRPAS